MHTDTTALFRDQLLDRRQRLNDALARSQDPSDLIRLLQEVDSALSRLDGSSFGECEVCHEQVDDEFLLANPLIQYCLCSLSENQLTALEQDLGLATRIQWALLPPQDLTWAGWQTHFRFRPAGPVSGDYCDLLPRNDGRELVFAVGDVSGKGVAASLLMAQLNATFRSLIDLDLALPDLVGRANSLLAGSSIRSHYATLVCGRAGGDGWVELCNAGHCPPVHLSGKGVLALESGESTGLPLGLVAGNPYEVTRFRLAPGESLVLYTDGLTEAREAGGTFYGTERLLSLLAEHRDRSPGEIASAVIGDLQEFRNGGAADDDATLLVLRRSR